MQQVWRPGHARKRKAETNRKQRRHDIMHTRHQQPPASDDALQSEQKSKTQTE